MYVRIWASQVVLVVKKPPVGDKETQIDPWFRKNPWRRAWPPTPAFLPGEPHKERSLVGYFPLRCKEQDRTEVSQPAYSFVFIYKTKLLCKQESAHIYVFCCVQSMFPANCVILGKILAPYIQILTWKSQVQDQRITMSISVHRTPISRKEVTMMRSCQAQGTVRTESGGTW